MNRLSLAAALLLIGGLPAFGQATLSVTPAYTYITTEAPHGAFRLRNEGTQPLEVIVTAEYGVIESDTTGSATGVILGTAGRLGDLTSRLTFFPGRLILDPGQERVVRYLVEGADALQRGGHIVLMHYRMQERAAVNEHAIPAIATAISIEYSLVTPLVVISGPGAARLSAKVLGVSEGALALMLVNGAAFPFAGGVSVERDGHVLGRTVTAVYTQRRVDIALTAPLTPGRFTLRFDGEYPGVPAATRRYLLVPSPVELQF